MGNSSQLSGRGSHFVPRLYDSSYRSVRGPSIAYAVADQELISTLPDEATVYVEKKSAELKQSGIKRVSTIAQYGLAADEIICLAQKTPHNLIAMCTHGHSGVKRCALGSVSETP